MAQSILITLTTIGPAAGPFDLYCVDTYGNVTGPFETGISAAALQAGYVSILVPDGCQIIRVKSNNDDCDNYVDLFLQTTTTSTTSTSTTTTTIAPTTTSTTISVITPVQLCLYGSNNFGTCLYACIQGSSPSSECITFYVGSNCTGNGCNIYLNNTLTTQADSSYDGVYSDGTNCYEITSGVITSYTLCSSATTEGLFLVEIGTSAASTINSISGSWFSLSSSFPYSVSGLPSSHWLNNITSSFSGNINIDVEITPFVSIYSITLKIYSGQTLVTNTCLPVNATISGSQTITFTGVTINSGDDVEISLGNGTC